MGEEKEIKFPKNKSGRRIHGMSPYMRITPFVMRDRGDASNYFRDSVEITELERFIREKRKEGYPGLGLLHLFVAAYVRTISQMPQLNRYIAGQRAYARKDIEVVMVVKRTMEEDGEDTAVKEVFEPTDTVFDVYDKLNAAIDRVKNGSETAAGSLADKLIKMPRLILKFFVGVLCLLDYFNLTPNFVLKASPFHGSMFITDIGSLGIPPIYHHLYNFGNLPIFISFGAKRRVCELNCNGEAEERRYVDFTVVTDERICDGYSYAQGLKTLKYCLTHPECLETPPTSVARDIY